MIRPGRQGDPSQRSDRRASLPLGIVAPTRNAAVRQQRQGMKVARRDPDRHQAFGNRGLPTRIVPPGAHWSPRRKNADPAFRNGLPERAADRHRIVPRVVGLQTIQNKARSRIFQRPSVQQPPVLQRRCPHGFDLENGRTPFGKHLVAKLPRKRRRPVDLESRRVAGRLPNAIDGHGPIIACVLLPNLGNPQRFSSRTRQVGACVLPLVPDRGAAPGPDRELNPRPNPRHHGGWLDREDRLSRPHADHRHPAGYSPKGIRHDHTVLPAIGLLDVHQPQFGGLRRFHRLPLEQPTKSQGLRATGRCFQGMIRTRGQLRGLRIQCQNRGGRNHPDASHKSRRHPNPILHPNRVQPVITVLGIGEAQGGLIDAREERAIAKPLISERSRTARLHQEVHRFPRGRGQRDRGGRHPWGRPDRHAKRALRNLPPVGRPVGDGVGAFRETRSRGRELGEHSHALPLGWRISHHGLRLSRHRNHLHVPGTVHVDTRRGRIRTVPLVSPEIHFSTVDRR